jgi:hypothetical protein
VENTAEDVNTIFSRKGYFVNAAECDSELVLREEYTKKRLELRKTSSIEINRIFLFLAGVALVAQSGRALSWYDRDHWFESNPGLYIISLQSIEIDENDLVY